MDPLIRPPHGDLERGLKELGTGESWAVVSKRDEYNAALYSPGVKWNVSFGNSTHPTELFGPVLGVTMPRNLDEAVDLVHQTEYGLTSGLESLNDQEQRHWMVSVKAGNLYVNRPTPGAIVLRQPFGGLDESAFGPGIKAGGHNYVAQVTQFSLSVSSDSDGRKRQTPKVQDKNIPFAEVSTKPLAEAIEDPLLDDLRNGLHAQKCGVR